MTTQPKARRVLLVSSLALILTVAGIAAAGYAWLRNRATPWGDSLVVGPGFAGEVLLDGGATRVVVHRESDGSLSLDVPPAARRRQVYLTYAAGFAVYHGLIGTSPGEGAGARIPDPEPPPAQER